MACAFNRGDKERDRDALFNDGSETDLGDLAREGERQRQVYAAVKEPLPAWQLPKAEATAVGMRLRLGD